jgi:hypothetical protein
MEFYSGAPDNLDASVRDYCTGVLSEGLLAEHPAVSRGGFGCSGVGRELGIGGLHEYTELKSVNYSGFSIAEAKENSNHG